MNITSEEGSTYMDISNPYLLSQLQLLEQLVSFSYYPSSAELFTLTPALLNMIDKRTHKKLASTHTNTLHPEADEGDDVKRHCCRNGNDPPPGKLLLFVYDLLECMPWLLFILSFVIVGVTFTVLQMFQIPGTDNAYTQAFEYTASLVFALDVTVKGYCYWR